MSFWDELLVLVLAIRNFPHGDLNAPDPGLGGWLASRNFTPAALSSTHSSS